jgi:hypothetical protein
MGRRSSFLFAVSPTGGAMAALNSAFAGSLKMESRYVVALAKESGPGGRLNETFLVLAAASVVRRLLLGCGDGLGVLHATHSRFVGLRCPFMQ